MFANKITPLTAALVFSIVLGACAPAQTSPTAAPAKPTEAAKPAAPAAAPAAPKADASPAVAAKPAASPAAAPAAPAAKPAASPAVAAKPAAPTQITKITMASGAASAVTAPIYIAIDHGIFAKHGIEVDMVALTGGSQVSQALASGSTQISTGGLGALMDAKLKGANLTIVGTLYPWHFFQIYSQPDIKTPQDLRGKTIAASDPGASSDRAIRDALEKYGLEADKDYNITYVGGTRERVLALEQKLADAAIISPPNGLIAGKKGFNKVVDLIAEQIPFGYSGIGANANWAKENPQVMVNFFKAYAESMALAKQDKQLAMQSLSKWLAVQEQDVLEESYELSIARMPILPKVEESLVRLMLGLSEAPEAKTANPATLVDNSYINQVEESGFVKTLPGQ